MGKTTMTETATSSPTTTVTQRIVGGARTAVNRLINRQNEIFAIGLGLLFVAIGLANAL
jgi:hypothetical protein